MGRVLGIPAFPEKLQDGGVDDAEHCGHFEAAALLINPTITIRGDKPFGTPCFLKHIDLL